MDVRATTLTQAFRDTVARSPDRVAVRTIDDTVSLTWAGLAARVDAVAGGLARLGLARGDTCAIMLSNRPEFHVVDLAATMLGATPFSVYQTLPPDQVTLTRRAPGSPSSSPRFFPPCSPLAGASPPSST